MNIQDRFPLELTDLISFPSKGLSSVFSSTTVRKHHFFVSQPSLWSNSHICTMTLGKTIALPRRTFIGKVMSLLFNMLSRFIIAFLPRSKCLLVSWLLSLSAVILEPSQNRLILLTQTKYDFSWGKQCVLNSKVKWTLQVSTAPLHANQALGQVGLQEVLGNAGREPEAGACKEQPRQACDTSVTE